MIRATVVAAACIASTAGQGSGTWDPTTGKTMNGDYVFGNPFKAPAQHRGTNWVEVVTPSYFSTYAQVNWDAFQVPLPADVVKELDGKLVNFVGYEFDLVQKDPKDPTNKTFVSVPAWELYNHHFGNSILGAGVKLVKTDIPGEHERHETSDDPNLRLFPGYRFVADKPKGGLREAPAEYTSGGLIVGNGAESRKTFHYYADGYGVLVGSPQFAAIHPMIIDTKNRAGNGTEQRPNGHGIVPRAATVGPEEMYSPIHECPCTDKWPKKISSYSTLNEGTCNPLVTDNKTCFDAAAELGLSPVKANMTVSNTNIPNGCSITATQGGYEIVFNSAPSSMPCGEPRHHASGPVLPAPCNLSGTWVNTNGNAEYVFTSNATNVYTVYQRGVYKATVKVLPPTASNPQGTLTGQWGQSALTAEMMSYSAIGSPTCTDMFWSNNVEFVKAPYNKNPPVPVVPARVAGTTQDLINVTVDIDSAKDLVTITLQGPSDVWFGAGFGYHHVSTGGADPSVGVSMVGTNWTLVVLGSGTVMERKLGNHEPGVQLPTTINVTSNTVVGNSRTVVVTRSIKGAASDDYSFDASQNQITFINAIGTSPYLMAHQAKSSNVIYMVELEYPTCICNMAGDQGTIGGYSWGTQRCVARPLGQMLDDPSWLSGPYQNNVSGHGVNPTCDIHKYRGGLRCCKGGTVILDSDQNVTNNYVFEWQLRYRYYYEIVEDESKVTNTFMTSWWTEHNSGEHDVPVCIEDDKTKCQNQISSNFTAGMMNGCQNGCQFITMEGHCHIGCIGMYMYIVDDPANPVLLCNASINYGKGDGWMDEMGYIAGANTCIFGPQGNGDFHDVVTLHPTTKLMSIKISNNTNPYTGDMALWEINAAKLPADYRFPQEKTMPKL